MSECSSSVHFNVCAFGARRSWLPYFLAAFSAGAAVADEALMHYHWIMPEEKVEKTPQVIRIQGEKGEKYEQVYAEDTPAALKQNPAIREAMLARQTALRKEAMELARQLREAGKEPIAAYEEAWTQVYSRNWLNGKCLKGTCKLEDMLSRMASENQEFELTETEKQWLLEALLEDDDCLESEAGQELLRRLAAQLRKLGYGRFEHMHGVNDELMKHFAEALQYKSDSMGAYREALFNTHRGSIMTHSLVGYRAPWGIAVGGRARYHQAPLQVETTEGSGNTQPAIQPSLTLGSGQQFTAPGLNELPGTSVDFLATAPKQPVKKNELEDEEEENELLEESETETEAVAPAMMSMRSFSMRSMAYAARSGDDTGTDENSAAPDTGAGEALYWNSTADAPAVWDTAQTQVWRDANGGELAYTAGSHVVFGEGDGLNKTVQIAEEGVAADSVTITGSNYLFQGGNMMVTERLSVAEDASMEGTLVIGSTTTPLVIDVAASKTLTLANLDTFYTLVKDTPMYEHGSFTKTGSGTLLITEATHGSISSVTVQNGVLAFGDEVTMDVGANRVKGGSLENVEMLVTGELYRPVTGDYVTVHNLVTSADGTSPGILRDVTFYAGTSTEYVTLHNISFAGQSTLTGYITFEKTQTTGDMSVADGGNLTVDNLTFDLRGLAMGEKTLIVVNDGATLSGWNADKVHFVYSGVTVNSAAVQFSKGDGIIVLTDTHDGDQFWTGSDDSMWNIASRNWSSEGSGAESFTALSNVYFGEGAAADRREISVVQDMVVANLGVTDGGYTFKGARVAVLKDASFTHEEGAVTFNNQLVVQGGLSAEGAGSVNLLGGATIVKDAVFRNLTTTIGGDMTVGGKLSVLSDSETTAAGSLTITGNVTAKEMELAVFAGAASGDNHDDILVNVTGNLTTTVTDGVLGSITIGGTAAQYYTGTVTAGNLIVNTQEHDVYFSYLQVGKLTVGEGASVHVQTSSDSVAVSSSVFPVIDLHGTLALDAAGTTYNHGYQVNVQNDAARLVFGSGSTIENLQIIGMQDNFGSSIYTDVDIEVQSHSATVTKMQNLGTLKVETGSLAVNNAGGAVHGELVLDNAKLKLGENSKDIMASGSGAVRLENGGLLDIGSTSQTLSSNKEVFLSGSSSITGDADGPGLLLGDGLRINYAAAGNSIDTKLTVEKDITLNSTSAGSSLEISGLISGSGEIELTGPGSVVLSSANTGFTGLVIVQDGSTLTLQNADALSNAGVVLNAGATLALDAPDAATLNALTLSSGSTLNISSIVGTDGLSAQDAVLQVGTSNIGSNALTLNVHFSDTLDTMTTYNIMSGLSSGNGLSLNVVHNGIELDDSQYTLGVNNGVLYIYTMMGNVWDGEGSKIWSATGEFKNWSEEKYNEDKNLGYTAAIFRDLTQTTEKVTVQGTVTPGDIYFTANETQYELVSNGTDGRLAAGTQIHKIGKVDVSLDLAGNASADNALGDVNVRAGSLILESALAVKGSVSVEKSALLKVQGGIDGLNMVNEKGEITYTASAVASGVSATLSGVTMDADGIRGVLEDGFVHATNLQVQGTAHLSNLTLKDFSAAGNVTLSDVFLSSSTATTLTDVTIGSGVVVDASGSYILSGNITFDGTLSNNGFVTLADGIHLEIGNIKYTSGVDDNNNPIYVYQFISSTAGGVLNASTITASQVSINGVNLASGLAENVGTVFTDNKNGSISLSIGNDTVGMPQWDARWGKTENAPSLSRRYVGADANAYVELAMGNGWLDMGYYRYASIVNDVNAVKVNGGKGAIVVTLSPGAEATLVVGGYVDWNGAALAADHEVWIDDRSGVKNVIGGLSGPQVFPKIAATSPQVAATHVLVNSAFQKNNNSLINYWANWDKQFIIGGSRWCNQNAESFVTVQGGEIYTIYGGSCGGLYGKDAEEAGGWGLGTWQEGNWTEFAKIKDDNGVEVTISKPYLTQTGTSHVFVDDGRIGEIFGGGYFANITGTQEVDGRIRAVELVLTGGVLGGTDLRIFGGTDHGVVEGDIYIRMEGSAEVKSRLVGGSNAGAVKGDIVLDLISGTANRVDAAGLGWKDGDWYYEPAYIDGDVRVNLYSNFQVGAGFDGGIYGGMEKSNHVLLTENCYSRLHFAEGEKYSMASIAADGYDTSEDSVIVTGFDRFELENKAHVVLGLGLFDIDMDPAKELVVSGKGAVEVIGHGTVYIAKDNDGKELWRETERNLGRNIRLEENATLMISTSVIGSTGIGDDRTIYVQDGTTIDFSGATLNTGYAGEGLGFKVEICGNGVDDKGAIYKGLYEDSLYPTTSTSVDRIVLPKVRLTGNASVNVESGETLHMNAYENDSEKEAYTEEMEYLVWKDLDLDGNTFTKFGVGDFITNRVDMTPGTILVQEGAFGFGQTGRTDDVDMVLAAGAELKLNATGKVTSGTADLSLRSLSGAGAVKLNGSTLTLHTEAGSAYYGEYMKDEAHDHDQFSETTGFGHAVFSGLISDGKGAGKLAKTGTGVHYISGSSNTYTGGTQLQEGRLYLLGTGEASTFTKGVSNAAAGVAGTGKIEWVSADAELYLGHGARIYNKGTTDAQGGFMTIGVEGVRVEGVPNAVLEDFVVTQSGGGITVTMGGVEYVEIDTHNLKSIDVPAVYADGTAYAAGTDIDRNKMLLVKMSDWTAAQDTPVTGFTATGYNEAIYSGILSNYSNSVASGLRKVGVGTLELDQTNSYKGGTLVEEGTLRLRGWGTVGSGAVQVDEGASLMLAYSGGYGADETIRLANNITLSGTGDAQWTILPTGDGAQSSSGAGHSTTDGLTAALISAVGRSVTFTLSGKIEGEGGVLHSGDGTLVLSGNSSYTGGTVITRGVVEVQSATGLGATAEGKGAVKLGKDADLHMTVKSGLGGGRLVTTLASVGDDIQGDVYIAGTKYTERVLHMEGNGYNAASTSLGEKGTFLLCGMPTGEKGVSSHSGLLTGNGTVVVSDATGSGTTATFDTLVGYTGDFRVEGNKASIKVEAGTYTEGSINVAGQQASLEIGGNVSIEAGESMYLRSTGVVPEQEDKLDMGTGAVLVSHGEVSVAADAVLSVRRGETYYSYNLSELEKAASVTVQDVVLPSFTGELSADAYHKLGNDVPDYDGRFDSSIAVNQQAVAGVNAEVGLTLAGGCTYETYQGHLSLMGGSLKLDTLENNHLTLRTTLDYLWVDVNDDAQLVLFSDVGSVTFVYDNVTATTAEPGVYYTRADRYLTGYDYLDSQTMLVYDSNVGVVYLQIKTPEPTTTTLGLVALAALAARRRRKRD